MGREEALGEISKCGRSGSGLRAEEGRQAVLDDTGSCEEDGGGEGEMEEAGLGGWGLGLVRHWGLEIASSSSGEVDGGGEGGLERDRGRR